MIIFDLVITSMMFYNIKYIVKSKNFCYFVCIYTLIYFLNLQIN